jgi:hypothetical protein
MERNTLFSSLAERWSEIREFPRYSISDHGKVRNEDTGRLLRQSYNSRGILQVGMMRNCRQYKKSVAVLVAQEYVRARMSERFDTVIHLDGNHANVHYENLMWRPLWFARKYHQQFPVVLTEYHVPIEDVETRERYDHTWDAAMKCGLLESEIYLSMVNNTYVLMTGQIFRQIQE